MFTIPVGNFDSGQKSLYRPTSVVDSANGGTITDSSNVYDADSTSYGVWTPQSGYTNRSSSVYSFTGDTDLIGYSLYFDTLIVPDGSSTYGIYQDAKLEMSLDGGFNYPYVFTFSLGSTDYTTRQTNSIPIPSGTLKSSMKVRFTSTQGDGSTFSYIYSIYIN